MRILRYPWTSTLVETLHSRIFELYIQQHFPRQYIEYLGRDFPLLSENSLPQSEYRENVFTGSLTQNPIRFLDQMFDVSNFVGVQFELEGSVGHKELGIGHLFKSETFCRELQSHLIGCRDSRTKKFLDDHEIPSILIGCVSSLLSKLDTKLFPNQMQIEYLFMDVTDEVEECILQSKTDNPTYLSISTKVLEVSGELQKTALVDSLLSTMNCSETIITSNLDLAIPAIALGKKTLLIEGFTNNDEFLSEYVTTVNVNQIIAGLTNTQLDQILNVVPRNNISNMTSRVEEFVLNVMGDAPRLKPNLKVDSYKEQVLSETINFQLMRIKNLEVIEEQMHGVLSSRSWKITVPLRVFSNLSSRCIEHFRSKSNRGIQDLN
jgi:hypothetical protein